jgi:CD151 antigen
MIILLRILIIHLQYIFIVMSVLVLEVGVGTLSRLYEEQVGPELRINLNRTFLETYSLKSKETAAIDQMQQEVSNLHFKV